MLADASAVRVAFQAVTQQAGPRAVRGGGSVSAAGSSSGGGAGSGGVKREIVLENPDGQVGISGEGVFTRSFKGM